MKTLVLTLVAVMAVSSAQADSTFLCSRPYNNDIFKTDLRLTASRTEAGAVETLWMDTHIPYGIRPLPYQVTTLQCQSGRIEIATKNSGGLYHVSFAADLVGHETQGTLTYLNEAGDFRFSQTLTCSVEALRSLCAGL